MASPECTAAAGISDSPVRSNDFRRSPRRSPTPRGDASSRNTRPSTRMKIAPIVPSYRRGPGRRFEERRRNDVLNLRRAGQRIHREGEGAERDRRRDKPLRNVAAAEKLGGERIDRKHDDEQRNSAIGQKRATRTIASMARSRPRTDHGLATMARENPESSISLPKTRPAERRESRASRSRPSSP